MSVYRDEQGIVQVGMSGDFVETKNQVLMIAQIATSVSLDEIDGAIQELNRLDTIGSMFDPTAYIRTNRSRDQLNILLPAFRKFRQAIEDTLKP